MNDIYNETHNCSNDLSEAVRASIALSLVFVFIVGGAGNCVLSILVTRHTKMRSVINILLAQMAVSDALISIFCSPLDLFSIILQKWIFGPLVCSLHAFFLSVFIVHNVTVLVIISIDRYSILVHKRNRLHDCNSLSLALGCFIFSFTVSSPPLFGIGHFTLSTCAQIHNTGTGDYLYFGLFSSLLFVLPCGLLLLAYVHIIVTLRNTSRRIRPECHREEPSRNTRTIDSIDVRFKQRTFSTILCLYVAAMTFKLPLGISLLVTSVKESVTCPMPILILVMTYLNSAVNPFIYTFKITTYWMVLNGKFRMFRNRVNSLRMSRRRSYPESVYRISGESTSSVV